MRRTALPLAALLLAPSTSAMAKPAPAPAAFMPRMTPVTIPESTEAIPGMTIIQSCDDGYAADYLPDVPYITRAGTPLRLQILKPRDVPPFMGGASEQPRRPLVIYVQGSGWGPQNIYSAIPQLAELAHRGYVVASVEYRPSTVATAPAQIQDVKTAIRFMRAHADEYGIDPDAVGIWGDSSGGHMAALVGTTEGVAAFDTADYPGQSDAVSAVADFYGVSDLRTLGGPPSWLDHDAPDSPGSLMLGASPLVEPERAAAQSPVHYISPDRKIPPFLLIHGDADAIVPFQQSVELYRALNDAGKAVDFYKVSGGNHGVRFWTPHIIQIVSSFFDRHLKRTDKANSQCD
ncbi:alpha/beta hydrolase fold domain-containing protein [Sphingopyxis sp. NJF-3]